MSIANKITGYTQIPTKDCDFTWVIKDFPLYWQKIKVNLMSPAFNVGGDDQMQFALKLNKISTLGGADKGRLDLHRVQKYAQPSCKYKITFIKDDKPVHAQSMKYTFSTTDYVVPILTLQNNELLEFISSTGTVIIHLVLSVFTGDEKKFLKKESVDTNKVLVPKYNFDWIFLNENLSDFKLKTASGKEIPAHRVVLANFSPVFKAMFSLDMLEKKSQSVDMIDISYDAAVEMLRYFYIGTIESRKVSLIIDLLVAADKYQVDELKNECERILSSLLSPENAVDILQVADKCNMKNLEKNAAELIK
ncbi:protein maternal effect lethal 26-like [Trichogramma pretiosum]|uniref:protein maternal effect lethal 26-like n=1 Tax=Trichogramma pretiosum TaxID=7493 RepID=UPI0006C9468A|nr:protein maternal effect lethal 26-like [Trichogramma pretiosum]